MCLYLLQALSYKTLTCSTYWRIINRWLTVLHHTLWFVYLDVPISYVRWCIGPNWSLWHCRNPVVCCVVIFKCMFEKYVMRYIENRRVDTGLHYDYSFFMTTDRIVWLDVISCKCCEWWSLLRRGCTLLQELAPLSSFTGSRHAHVTHRMTFGCAFSLWSWWPCRMKSALSKLLIVLNSQSCGLFWCGVHMFSDMWCHVIAALMSRMYR